MATTFLEPGGDATFVVSSSVAGSFWDSRNGTPTIVTDFVHGNHIKSIRCGVGSFYAVQRSGVLADSGRRISLYVYIAALPTATATLFSIQQSAGSNVAKVRLTSAGVLQIFEATNQIGTNGSTLSTGIWYRLSLAYTITSTIVNRFELFKDSVSDISITNATITNSTSNRLNLGFNEGSDATFDFRASDIYVDDSSSLTDTGNIWVTAKRPNANGTTNGFTGSGAGSGYGTGNSVYVNERALSTASLVSMVGAGSAVTEEYNIESFSTGDMTSPKSKIVDLVGWYYMSSLVGETVQVIINGVSTAQAITSTNTMYTKVAGFAGYPASTGADVGITTDTSLTTVSLFECGIMVAFIPATNLIGNYPPYIHSGALSRNERAT